MEIHPIREAYISYIIRVPEENQVEMDCKNIYATIQIDGIIKEFHMLCMEEIYRFDSIFSYNYDEEQIFKNDFKIHVYVRKMMPNREFENFIYLEEIELKMIPNSIQNFKAEITNHSLEISIIFRCIGYDGYNCHRKMKEEELEKIKVKNPRCKNPNDCLDTPCVDNKYCNDRGSCFIKILDPSEKICVCYESFYGIRCEKSLPKLEISEDMLLFQPIDSLIEDIRPKDCQECPNGECKVYGRFKVCTSENAFDILSKCDKYCEKLCGLDICRKRISKKVNSLHKYI